jgi:hypothetical protein
MRVNRWLVCRIAQPHPFDWDGADPAPGLARPTAGAALGVARLASAKTSIQSKTDLALDALWRQ